MQADKCQSVRNALLKHVAEMTLVEYTDSVCVATLPIITLDGRLVDVFIEPRNKDFFLVHDAGKAMNELILQGIEPTASVRASFAQLASHYNIRWADETFQAGCNADRLNARILSVGSCSAMAMFHALGHSASEVGEPSSHEQLGEVLRKWAGRRIKVRESVPVKGALKQHSFDFVAYPGSQQPVAISLLSPSVSALSAAERYGFKVQDVESENHGQFLMVAVEEDADRWSLDARNIVRACSAEVIELNSLETRVAPKSVIEALDRLIA